MKSEARNSAGTFLEDQCETKLLNPKLETLNSKQTQISKAQNSKLFNLLNFGFV